jgi:hypothetical protein
MNNLRKYIIFILIIARCLNSYGQNSNKSYIEFVDLDFLIFTPISIDCGEFEHQFKGEIFTREISDSLSVLLKESVNQFVECDAGYCIDTRAKLYLWIEDKYLIICISKTAIQINSICYSNNDNFWDIITKICKLE